MNYSFYFNHVELTYWYDIYHSKSIHLSFLEVLDKGDFKKFSNSGLLNV